jgi:hypothetical protein
VTEDEYDAQEDLGYDLQENLIPDISTRRQDLSALRSDLSNLQTMGLPGPAGADAAITSAQNAIGDAISTANADITHENGNVSQAYSLSDSIATGNCAGDGAGPAPSPIQDISETGRSGKDRDRRRVRIQVSIALAGQLGVEDARLTGIDSPASATLDALRRGAPTAGGC